MGALSAGFHFPWQASSQEQAAAAVVIPTVGRQTLACALVSLFAQDLTGLIQVLVGVDVGAIPEAVAQVIERRPPNVAITTLQLPYSTSMRHGGLHPPRDGGALRTALSYLANSRFVAYMDDDNRFRADHLRLLRAAIHGKAFAFSRRRLVDGVTGAVIGVDIWDSVGPNRGRMGPTGGFVDPSCLMVDKLAVQTNLARWSQTRSGTPAPSDLWFFEGIRHLPHGDTGEPTVDYTVREDSLLRQFAERNFSVEDAMQFFPRFKRIDQQPGQP
jgi:hypothetical protein